MAYDTFTPEGLDAVAVYYEPMRGLAVKPLEAEYLLESDLAIDFLKQLNRPGKRTDIFILRVDMHSHGIHNDCEKILEKWMHFASEAIYIIDS